MWKRFIEWCQVLSLIVAVLAIVTANSSSTALSNTLSFIPGLITRNSGILAWVFGYLSFGLWAWLRFRAYDHVFYKKPPGDASDGENKNQKVVADTWFQQRLSMLPSANGRTLASQFLNCQTLKFQPKKISNCWIH
ncbi:MAG: hypothetical protein ACLPJW_01310 [Rhodomicrobium sp.]